MKDSILKALNWRYATQVFDTSKTITDEELHTILESGRLSPSSFGLEAWKFIVVDNPDIRIKLRKAGYNQPKITDASRLIVITYRTDIKENVIRQRIERIAKTRNQKIEELDEIEQMLNNSVANKSDLEINDWAKAQAYIPLGIMVETASLLGIDSGPMEGFSADQVDDILNLREKHLRSTSMLALGHRGEDPNAANLKIRQNFDEVVEFIK